MKHHLFILMLLLGMPMASQSMQLLKKTKSKKKLIKRERSDEQKIEQSGSAILNNVIRSASKPLLDAWSQLRLAAFYRDPISQTDQWIDSVDINETSKSGRTALHTAAYTLSVNYVVWLLNKGANPNIKDDYGRTPLHDCMRSSIYNYLNECSVDRNREIASHLLRFSAESDVKDNKGRTPNYYATPRGIDLRMLERNLIFEKIVAEITAEEKGISQEVRRSNPVTRLKNGSSIIKMNKDGGMKTNGSSIIKLT